MVALYDFINALKCKNHFVQCMYNKQHYRKVSLSSFHLNGQSKKILVQTRMVNYILRTAYHFENVFININRLHQYISAMCSFLDTIIEFTTTPGGGVLLGILGRGVPPGSPNPDPISDQNMPFSTPVFRPGL